MQYLEPSSRREWFAVLGLTLIGAALRFRGFGGLGLTHFDEGIYALSGLWSISPAGMNPIDPMVVPYAPPGFPILVGLAYLVIGVSDAAAILASTLCGILTIPVAAWLGRRTFGAGAGVAAAAFVAFSMPHIAFSRKALTDVPFHLLWLIAVGLGGRYLERPSCARAVALGIGVGLAQCLKYNGWLTGAVCAFGAALGLLLWSEERSVWIGTGRRRGVIVFWSLLSVGIALLVYSPWYLFVERHGGYRALIAHHQSYVGGAARWLPYWTQQQAQLVALSGGSIWGALTWCVAWLGYVGSSGGGLGSILGEPKRGLRAFAVLTLGAAAMASLASFPWWIGLALTPWLLLSRSPARRMIGCWWLLLSVLTPLYHPYARLWMPLHGAGWLLLAGLLVELIRPEAIHSPESALDLDGRSGNSGRSAALRPLVLSIAVAAGFAQVWSSSARSFPVADFFKPTAQLRDVVTALPSLIPPSGEASPSLSILGRRPLSFYLLLQGRFRFGLAESLNDLLRRSETWAILDEAVLDAAKGSIEESQWGGRVVKRFDGVLDPVTRLDVAPGSVRASESSPNVSILLLAPSNSRAEISISQTTSPPTSDSK